MSGVNVKAWLRTICGGGGQEEGGHPTTIGATKASFSFCSIFGGDTKDNGGKGGIIVFASAQKVLGGPSAAFCVLSILRQLISAAKVDLVSSKSCRKDEMRDWRCEKSDRKAVIKVSSF